MTFKELSKQYLLSVEFAQMEKNSQKMYKSWLNRIPAMATMNSKELFFWLRSLNVRASTKNHAIAVLRAVYGWGVRHHAIKGEYNLAKDIKNFRSSPNMAKGYTKEEVQAVCDEAKSSAEKVCASFLKILFWTGARPSEILELKWKDIDYDTGLISISSAKKREKGALSRYCNLLPTIVDGLQTLYETESPRWRGPNYYVFKLPSVMGNRQLKVNYARENIRRVSRRIGIAKTLRQARTGLATSMLTGGYSLTEVQQTLGHRTIVTTQRYIRLSKKEKARAFTGL